MILKTLHLRQFRNHRHLELSIKPGVNLFLGSNGAGKTNLLEALAVLATGVSPRAAETESMVQWGESGFAIHGRFVFDDEKADPLSLEMKCVPGSPRTIRQNGRDVVKLRDLLGRVPLVSFVPEDLALVKGEPDLRRRTLNMVLMQVDPHYAETLRRYNHSLKSRNAALRQLAQGEISEDALAPWDEAVLHEGLVLCQKRADFLEDFSKRLSLIQERISGGQEQVRLEYKPSFAGPWGPEAEERWRILMTSARAHEMALGATVTGPHRDDFSFVLNGRPARSFASEGQQRTCAVAFKLSEIPYLQEKLEQRPICLLDDVLSELDHERAGHLLEELSHTGQCLVTLTGLESWPKDFDLPHAIFRVDQTGVHPETMEFEVSLSVN